MNNKSCAVKEIPITLLVAIDAKREFQGGEFFPFDYSML